MGLERFFKKKEPTEREKQEMHIRNTVELKSYRQYKTFKTENKNFNLMLYIMFFILGVLFLTALSAYIMNIKRSNWYSPEIHEVFGEAARANDFVNYTQDIMIFILTFTAGFADLYSMKLFKFSKIMRYIFYGYAFLTVPGFLSFPFTSYEMFPNEKILSIVMGIFSLTLGLLLYIKGYFTGYKRIKGLFIKTYPKVFIVCYGLLIILSLYLTVYSIYAFKFTDFPFR